MRTHELTLKIIGAIIAFLVVVMMVWDHFTFRASIKEMAEQNVIARESVEKMAEQNKLSEKSISRMDSSLALMHESNKLQSQSIALEIARNEVIRSEITEKTRPKIYVKPLNRDDIKEDTSKYEVWCTINNKGLSEADSVVLKTFVKGEGETTVDTTPYLMDKLQSGEGRVFPTDIRKDLVSFFMLIRVDYHWHFPGLPTKPFTEEKAYKILLHADDWERTTVRMLDKHQLKQVFQN